MNGHTLTTQGGGSCGLYNEVVNTPGNIYVGNTGTFTFENGSSIGGDANMIVQFAANARFVSQNQQRAHFKRSFKSLGNMTFTCGNGKNGNVNPGWNGPMELGGELTLVSTTHPAEFAGKITGTGGIKPSNTSTVLTLMGTNTYEGTTKVVNGTTLKAKRLAAIPGMAEGRLSIAAGGAVEVDATNVGENSDADILAACVGTTTNSTWSFDSAHLWVNPGSRVMSEAIAKSGVYGFAPGNNVFTIASEISNSPDMEFKNGTTIFARGEIVPEPGTWIGRKGGADEMARAIVFLAADESGFMTGVDLPVDGGRILGPHNCDM